jgi:hypothetical protein
VARPPVCDAGDEARGPGQFPVRLTSGWKAAIASLGRLVPRRCWETRSCGPGCMGHRDYELAWAATSSPRDFRD